MLRPGAPPASVGDAVPGAAGPGTENGLAAIGPGLVASASTAPPAVVSPVVPDAGIDWAALRRLTAARIGLGRAGPAIATADHLAFQAAHALARDAVHAELDLDALGADVAALGLHPVALRSACPDLAAFLSRPDLGRQLAPEAAGLLVPDPGGCDLSLLLLGGLSATAVARHAVPLLRALLPGLAGWRIGPVAVVGHGRVALGDAVAAGLGARLSVVLVGERPGLSAPDSLGAYVTWEPRVGRSDAERNCLSNIRPEGMSYAEAAGRLLWLMREARRLGVSGVALKDGSDAGVVEEGKKALLF